MANPERRNGEVLEIKHLTQIRTFLIEWQLPLMTLPRLETVGCWREPLQNGGDDGTVDSLFSVIDPSGSGYIIQGDSVGADPIFP